MHKLAPNVSDQVVIRERMEAGQSPAEIARVLNIEFSSVKAWCDHFEKNKDKLRQEELDSQKQAAEAKEAAERAELERLKAKFEKPAAAAKVAPKTPTPNPKG